MKDRMVDFIILIGPPGVGKTYLGHRLRDELGCQYQDLETDLLKRFGTGEQFAANKKQALRFIEQTLRDQHQQSQTPVVVETTGLSDREMLNRLAQAYRVLWVAVSAQVEQCVRRVQQRRKGTNLNNDPEYTRQFHTYWHQEVSPNYDFDVVIGNDEDNETDGIEVIRGILRESGGF